MFKSESALTQHEQKHDRKNDVKHKEKDNAREICTPYVGPSNNTEYEKALQKAKLLPDIINKEILLKGKLDKMKANQE